MNVGPERDAMWTISGIAVTVDDDTVVGSEIEVVANGRIQGDTWPAHSIQRVPADEAAFDISGTVKSWEYCCPRQFQCDFLSSGRFGYEFG